MSLCLIDVHGDIEGDFEWVEDLPKNRKEFLIAIKELKEIEEKIGIYESDCMLSCSDINCKACNKIMFGSIHNIINRHISKLKGDVNNDRL